MSAGMDPAFGKTEENYGQPPTAEVIHLRDVDVFGFLIIQWAHLITLMQLNNRMRTIRVAFFGMLSSERDLLTCNISRATYS